MRRAWRPARAQAAALLLLPAAWWACRLWVGLPGRAFDNSDPTEQLDHALVAANALRDRGAFGWLAALASDPGAKPLQSAALSAGMALGIPRTWLGYDLITGAFVIALFVALQAQIARGVSREAAVVFAGLTLSSNVLLQQALYGGHSWYGQLFVWLAAGRFREQAPPLAPAAAFVFGALLGCAFGSSYHMAPLVAALGALWVAAAGRRLFLDRRWRAAAKAALAAAAGLAAPAAFLEAATFAVPKNHYWQTLSWQLQAARGVPETYRATRWYLVDFLRHCESPALAAAVAALALTGVAVAARRWAQGRWDLAPWVLLPAASLAFIELPQTIKLARTCLPLVVGALPIAALGADRILKRWCPERARLTVAASLVAIALAANARPRAETWAAFHAGPAIEAAIAAAGGAGPAVVVGPSIPFIYEPGRELRVGALAQLEQAVAAGHQWVLVSYLSPWWWNGFMSRDRFDIPVHEIYEASVPFIAVPGIESSSLEPFTNEAIYAKVRGGEIPFPRENRLYRASDFLPAARAALARR